MAENLNNNNNNNHNNYVGFQFTNSYINNADIEEIFKFLELEFTPQNANIQQLERILFKVFRGEALRAVNTLLSINGTTYLHIKANLIGRYSVRSLENYEDQLLNLNQLQYSTIIEYLQKFQSLFFACGTMSIARGRELFIRGINDRDFKMIFINGGEFANFNLLVEYAKKCISNLAMVYPERSIYRSQGYNTVHNIQIPINNPLPFNQQIPINNHVQYINQVPIRNQVNQGRNELQFQFQQQLNEENANHLNQQRNQNHQFEQQQQQMQQLIPRVKLEPTNAVGIQKKFSRTRWNDSRKKQKHTKKDIIERIKLNKNKEHCTRCGYTNHNAENCRVIINSISRNDNNGIVGSLTAVLQLNEHKFRCLIDSGSTATIINKSVADQIGSLITPSNSIALQSASGDIIGIIGRTSLEISVGHNGKKHLINKVIVSNDIKYNCIIGMNTLSELNAIIDIGNLKLSSFKSVIFMKKDEVLPPIEKITHNNAIINISNNSSNIDNSRYSSVDKSESNSSILEFALPFHAILENVNTVTNSLNNESELFFKVYRNKYLKHQIFKFIEDQRDYHINGEYIYGSNFQENLRLEKEDHNIDKYNWSSDQRWEYYKTLRTRLIKLNIGNCNIGPGSSNYLKFKEFVKKLRNTDDIRNRIKEERKRYKPEDDEIQLSLNQRDRLNQLINKIQSIHSNISRRDIVKQLDKNDYNSEQTITALDTLQAQKDKDTQNCKEIDKIYVTHPNSNKEISGSSNQLNIYPINAISEKDHKTFETLEFNNDYEKSIVLDIVKNFSKLFTEKLDKPGNIETVHNIKLNTNNVNFAPYPVKYTEHQRVWLEGHIKELLECNVIRDSNSPVASSIVLRPKDDVTPYRMCINFTKLNNITVKDRFPIPEINEMWNHLRGATVFTKLDMIAGYYQIPICEQDKYLTAFQSPVGLHEFNVMPFGLTNAPATFQRLMNKILSSYIRKFVLVYFDDILIYSKSVSDHIDHVKQVFAILMENKLLLKLKKCLFFKESVKFLGHIISSKGVEIDYSRIDPLLKLTNPTNVKDLQRLLGTINYFRRHIVNLSSKLSPIYALVKDGVKFEWTINHKKIIDSIINGLIRNKVVLAYPNPNQDFVLETDASNVGIGSVLKQDGKIISFFSKSITGSEINYSTAELECLAVIKSLDYFHHIIGSANVEIITDNAAITILKSDHGKIKNKRLTHWNIKLGSYNIKFTYRAGVNNIIADALSRCPLESVYSISSSPSSSSQNEDTNLSIDSNNDSNLSLENIKVEQRKDENLIPLINYIEKRELETEKSIAARLVIESPFHCIVNGILYRLITNPSKFFKNNQVIARCIVVPQSLIRDVIKSTHDDALVGGHLGYQKTFGKIVSRYYWINMFTDIREYINNCDICQRVKTSPHDLFHPPLSSITVNKPFEVVAVDYIGPIQDSTTRGNSYILVFSDYVTKWVEAVATPDCSAETTAIQFINLIICRHGCPSRLISDCGTSFLNEVIKNVNDALEIKKSNTTPYHPQTDGLVERFNKTIIQMIKCFTQDQHLWWDQYLELCLFAYRISIQASSGYSPFELLYGRNAVIPSDIKTQHNFIPQRTNINDKFGERIKKMINRSLALANKNITAAQLRQQNYYDTYYKLIKTIKIGDQVLLKNHTPATQGQVNKFLVAWIGPFKVLEIISLQTIRIQLPLGSRVSPSQSISNCKLYKQRMEKLSTRIIQVNQNQFIPNQNSVNNRFGTEPIQNNNNQRSFHYQSINHIPTPVTTSLPVVGPRRV